MIEPKIQNLLKKIKEKRELSGIADSVVLTEIENYLNKNKINLENLKNSDLKLIVKSIRANLRILTGQYQKSQKFRNKFENSEDFKNVLTTHASTQERLSFYPTLKRKISELKIKSILDLGCGINPIALASQFTKYYACDINEPDLKLVEKFFKLNNLNGKTFICDLRNPPSDFPKTDLCIIFKVLDLIDKKNHSATENLINKIPAKKLLISFPTKKLSGKKMNFPRRGWIEKLLERLGFKFETFSSDNEIFYLAEKLG